MPTDLAARSEAEPGFRVTGRFVLACFLAFFGVIFAVNFVFMRLALSTLPGTVVDSPYRSSQAFNGELAAARAEAARGWQMVATVRRAANGRAAIAVRVEGAAPGDLAGTTLSALLMRPTWAADDRRAVLALAPDGSFGGQVENLVPGAFDLVLELRRGDERLLRSAERLVLN